VEIKKQIKIALEEAQAIIFLVDAKEGLMPQEREWARALRQSRLPIFLTANKADNPAARERIHNPEWLKLGLGEPMPVSAASGSGVGDLLDVVIKKLKGAPGAKPRTKEKAIRVSIIGRPNVGKSTLFNALIGEERVIISPIAHTTRESHDTLILKDGEPFLFVDTAGIRRRARVQAGLEKMGVNQTISTIMASDVVLLVLDIEEPFNAQDKNLINLIGKKHKGLIIIINKWDLVAEAEASEEELREKFLEQVSDYFPFLKYTPIIFISAKTHLRVHKIFDLIKMVAANRQKQIGDDELRRFLLYLTRKHLPTRGKGARYPKIYSLKQIDVAPPTFEVAIKQKTSLQESYLKYIANELQKRYDFSGTPVIVYARKIKI
jgi:GTP-binding protein